MMKAFFDTVAEDAEWHRRERTRADFIDAMAKRTARAEELLDDRKADVRRLEARLEAAEASCCLRAEGYVH